MKGIVEIAKVQQVEVLKESSLTLAKASIGVDAKDGAKVLAVGAQAGAAVGDKATAIVLAVRGEEMLAAIVNATETDVKTISANASGTTTPLEFVVGGSNSGHLAQEGVKAGSVSGGIVLRALVKDGKLAEHSDNDDKAVQSTGITAVNKLLGAVEEIIKKTVKKVIEKAKGEIDKARVTKTTE